MRRAARVFAVALACGLACGVLTAVGARRASDAAAAPPTATPELDRLSGDLQTLSRRVSPAVVQVFASSLTPAPGAGDAAGGLLSRQRGIGSGVIGSPLGLESSVSIGVISATVRQLEPDSPMIYLQTDASIHPGNSGGPLVNTRGGIVGINTFILGSPVGDGMGFAAPSNIVSAVYQQIRQHGRVRRGEIGVRAQTITAELARGLGLERDWGVILADVFPGGPAAQAGLRHGDVVSSLNGKVMENGRQLEINLYRHGPGEEVTLEIQGDGVQSAMSVKLRERPGDLDRLAALARAEDHLIEPLQILALEVDPQVAQMVPMREPWGVLVALSRGDAPPGGAPLVPGDVIRSIGRATVRTLEDLRRGLTGHPSGAWVVLHVERGGRMIYVPCEIP